MIYINNFFKPLTQLKEPIFMKNLKITEIKVTLNCLCKEDYFKAYFEMNKKDFKKIWYGIKTLIYTKISTSKTYSKY